jgi:hypothetical protein
MFLFGVSVTFTMPFTFSFSEDAGGVYVYGFCGGDTIRASAEYQRRFLRSCDRASSQISL